MWVELVGLPLQVSSLDTFQRIAKSWETLFGGKVYMEQVHPEKKLEEDCSSDHALQNGDSKMEIRCLSAIDGKDANPSEVEKTRLEVEDDNMIVGRDPLIEDIIKSKLAYVHNYDEGYRTDRACGATDSLGSCPYPLGFGPCAKGVHVHPKTFNVSDQATESKVKGDNETLSKPTEGKEIESDNAESVSAKVITTKIMCEKGR
ncbi:hypothetical protein PIB30_036081 [Stylosanthes scabra]|uniref:DUF4283 domain-containing protein n=1 Tax=Stylosanthes scabra TaxID=79078 RepID=A0ABU6SD91_9FABA|nr:hypothetical protein [Stylosanthes scabra]